MPRSHAAYSPWEATDEADEAVTGPLDAASREQVEGLVLELLVISESRVPSAAGSDIPDEESR